MRYILSILKISFLLLSISFNLNAQITFKTIIIESNPDNMKDAVISDFPAERNLNFGNSKQIIASRLNKNTTNYLQRSLFKFDLSDLPPNCSIAAADLFLYAYDSLGFGNHTPTNGNATFDFAPILEDWDENSVTWDNQPLFDSLYVTRQNAPRAIKQNYINNPITNLIRNMYSNPSEYFGIMMKLRTEINTKRVNFYSSDYSDAKFRPKLKISYIINDDTNAPYSSSSRPIGLLMDDAFISNHPEKAALNFGSDKEVPIQTWDNNGVIEVSRGLFNFDLIKQSLVDKFSVVSAFISFYGSDIQNGLGTHDPISGTNAIIIERITSNWEESTVTWNNQPTTSNENIVEIPGPTEIEMSYHLINVTPIVKDMFEKLDSSFGFLIRLKNEIPNNRINLLSSDSDSYPKFPAIYLLLKEKTSDIDEVETEEPISIFPNPSQGGFKISSHNNITCLEIFDLIGNKIGFYQDLKSKEEVLMDNLSSGIYLLKIIDHKGNSLTRKLIVNK